MGNSWSGGEQDIRIGEVSVDLEITEGIGPLAPGEVRSLVALVLEQVRREQDRRDEHARDTRIHDRAFRPTTG
jgi:hypothetical protein